MKENISIIIAVIAILFAIASLTNSFIMTPETTTDVDIATGTELDDDIVTSSNIVDRTITDEDIVDSGITKIADESITLAHLTPEVLAAMSGVVDILDNSILGNKLANHSIMDYHIYKYADIDPTKIEGTAWTAENDGEGSGLDADTLEGFNASDFANSTHSHGGLLLRTSLINIPCPASGRGFGDEFVKIDNLGSYNQLYSGSTMDIAFYGRITTGGMTSPGAIFELRVDNEPSTLGSAQTVFYDDWADTPKFVVIRGIFPDIDEGIHTISMWVKASQEDKIGLDAMCNPGCWHSDKIIVQEFK